MSSKASKKNRENDQLFVRVGGGYANSTSVDVGERICCTDYPYLQRSTSQRKSMRILTIASPAY